ncbi:MAG: hypothetical protein DIKNOCCD_00906 [bacterium]|nr:hypothetical protein [bacterium]MCE7907467.1 sugar phosphate isomerase/epimerase [Candidatus Omnitrophica bacterium COP1]
MSLQAWQAKSEKIRTEFLKLKKEQPDKLNDRLNLSWSNWGFGMESLSESAGRLSRNQIRFIELHGNAYGPDLAYKPVEAKKILQDHGIEVAGICGMFSPDNELASNRGVVRQRALDYIRRTIDQALAFGGKYILVVPAAVGRPTPIDPMEFDRSVDTLKIVADDFAKAGLRCAIEPIRSAEVSIVHTFSEAERYIQAVGSPGVQHINGDVYHMLVEESHIPETIVKHGSRLTNLHLADTNRCALGDGMLDVDTLIMALYLIGYNNPDCFCTPEPLGPGGDPYPAMFGKPDPALLDRLVSKSADHWREREEWVRSL